MSKGTEMNRPSGFTLIELLVVIAIMSLLVSILMPSLQKAKEMARDLICTTHQRNVALAFFYYAEDFDSQIPVTTVFKSGFWFLSWCKRIGRLPEFDPNDRPLPNPFPRPPDPTWWFPEDSNFPQARISSFGYIDFNWAELREGHFKCPAYWDQVGYRPPKGVEPEVLGHQFTMNRMLEPPIADWTEEGKETLKCVRFTDVKKNAVLIGDCGIKPLPYGTWPSYRYDYYRYPSMREYTEPELTRFGPWPWMTFIEVGMGGRSRRTFRVDYYGHTGGVSNMCFTDGHVEAIKEIKPEHFTIR